MKCAICRQPAPPGQRLCAPCRAALKRARDTTVSEAIVPTRRARRRSGRSEEAQDLPPAVPAHPAARRGSRDRYVRVALAFLSVGVLAAAGAWLAQLRPSDVVAPRYAVAPTNAGGATIDAAATAAPGPTSVPKSSTSAQRAAPAPATSDGTPASARGPIDPRAMPSSIALPKAPAAAAPATLAPAELPRGTATDPGLGAFNPTDAPAPAPVVVAALPAPKQAPDRWQRLSEALARCPADDLIAGTVCRESLRIEHCGGHWGRVAPCPARVERDYGN